MVRSFGGALVRPVDGREDENPEQLRVQLRQAITAKNGDAINALSGDAIAGAVTTVPIPCGLLPTRASWAWNSPPKIPKEPA